MKSMTGCGRGQVIQDGLEITVELKSVNHRFLDISLRLPRNLQFLEEMIRTEIGQKVRRGHFEVFINVQRQNSGDRKVEIDETLAKEYAEAAAKLSTVTGIPHSLTIADIMSFEGVVNVTEKETDENEILTICRKALDEALEHLDIMRKREGVSLASDLTKHLELAAGFREQILERAPAVVEDYRQRLTARLSHLDIEPVEPQRLAQEVALMADHCAIDEELSRLESHIKQMKLYIQTDGEIGKKMDFLIQEMNRETNTIGSKASDAAIARYVVDMKSEIEKLREQIQNVE